MLSDAVSRLAHIMVAVSNKLAQQARRPVPVNRFRVYVFPWPV